ncbi:MAG: hypothetical protein HQL82_08140 [Magnetococcales bacterium]|nr:hypothetical protein [Magnetococcales bacterium]
MRSAATGRLTRHSLAWLLLLLGLTGGCGYKGDLSLPGQEPARTAAPAPETPTPNAPDRDAPSPP